ncbi:regulatory protein RecX [Microbacterium allomyrinae]|uniref:Regulatory protein RecX n=1 Tax=Microbacterium allomyrinae TaxID=2830666 RepID=A0A9X1LXE9_9MICO|nr:regulatory protein RecX [Microbacterium allomyrinae]MCC2033849.1 regulatory protein RecX [Microbacterium allomyrinae]
MVRFIDSGGESGIEAPAESDEGLAPVIPLFGGAIRSADSGGVPAKAGRRDGYDIGRHDVSDHRDVGDTRGPGSASSPDDDTDDAADRENAEKELLKKLRARSLSVREARAVIGGRGLDAETIEDVLERFLDRGYLDDAALAEQLVHIGIDRKGQGRQVIAQALAKRGVPRDVADLALEALPDDDAERALDFARTKARALSRLDHDTALRRLTGQLARRGYPGSVSLSAARQALAEEAGSSSGVRFR